MNHLQVYLPLILLTIALVVGLVVARRIWSETHEDLEPASERELLWDLEKAHAAGELDAAELRKVRELLSRPQGSGPPFPRIETGGSVHDQGEDQPEGDSEAS